MKNALLSILSVLAITFLSDAAQADAARKFTPDAEWETKGKLADGKIEVLVKEVSYKEKAKTLKVSFIIANKSATSLVIEKHKFVVKYNGVVATTGSGFISKMTDKLTIGPNKHEKLSLDFGKVDPEVKSITVKMDGFTYNGKALEVPEFTAESK